MGIVTNNLAFFEYSNYISVHLAHSEITREHPQEK